MNVILATVFFLLVFLIPQTPVHADDPLARAIMKKVDALDDGDNMTADMKMVLIDGHDNRRERTLRIYRKDKGPDVLQLLVFASPADIRGTGFLTVDYRDASRDDDQWLYLPALRKSKRIALADKSSSFMGSDLNYSDMTTVTLDDYDFSFYKTRETTVDGIKTWVIESTPRSADVIRKTGYTRSILFVRQDNDCVIRGVFYESGGDQKFLDVKRLERIDTIWFRTVIHMTRKRNNITIHRTELSFDHIRFNQPLREDLFTTRQLEKGPS